MKITLKNREIIKHINDIVDISNEEKESGKSKFTTKINFKIHKNFKKLLKEYEEYIEFKNKIDEKHIKVDENDEKSVDDICQYNQELNELLDSVCELDVATIKEDDIFACDDVTIAQIDAISFMIQE